MGAEQQAQAVLAQAEEHFKLEVEHRAEGNRLLSEYKRLMYPIWDGYTIGEGEG